jgi:hypothetical protein
MSEPEKGKVKKKNNIAYKIMWWMFRTTIFLFVGLRFTLYIEPGEVGSFEHYLGFVMLVVAIVDGSFVIRNYLASSKKKD